MRELRRTALPCGFMVIGLVSGLSLANHSDRVLGDGVPLVQPRWMPARILGGGWTCGASF